MYHGFVCIGGGGEGAQCVESVLEVEGEREKKNILLES